MVAVVVVEASAAVEGSLCGQSIVTNVTLVHYKCLPNVVLSSTAPLNYLCKPSCDCERQKYIFQILFQYQ